MAACIICQSILSHRFYKSSNPKCKKEIFPKLAYLFHLNDLQFPTEFFLCSSCIQKIENAYAIIIIVTLARAALIPYENLILPQEEVIPVADATEPNSIPSEDISMSEPDDHSYSVRAESRKKESHHIHVIRGSTEKSKYDIRTAKQMLKDNNLKECIQEVIVEEIGASCVELTTKTGKRSVLSQMRPMEILADESERLIPDIIAEISIRMPLVYQILLTIAGIESSKKDKMKVIPSVATAYAILLHNRHSDMSAFHRLTSAVCLEGHLTDEGFTRLNHLGMTQSARSKLNMQEECSTITKQNIVKELKSNPLVKIVGDNLDIYNKAAHERRTKANTDLHMFASTLVFSRVATPDLSNIEPIFNLDAVKPEHMTLHGNYTATLRNAYILHISKLLIELPAFDWLRPVTMKSRFPYERQMSMKTKRFLLPVQHKNENKLEECCDILDAYEEYLNGAFLSAFGEGDTSIKDFKVTVGGDQLTRVRLQEAKHLRNIAFNPHKRFEDLHPIVVEMWHNKQDLLEKAYKKLYDIKSARQPGTLFHAKSILQRSSVNGKVKSRFKAHHDLFMTLGKVLVKEHLMEFLGMDSENTPPTKHISSDDYERGKRWMTHEEKSLLLQSVVAKFLDSHNFLEFDPYIGPSIGSTNDELHNYCTNMCHWYLQILETDDTAKTGDVTRVIPNCMNAIPLFFSHSRLSKYFVENIDYILKCEFIMSPLQRMRVLEGSFVNLRGGAYNNMESDLMQENSIRVIKNLIKQLGANKSTCAINRTTAAAETIKAINDGLDCYISSSKNSSKHKSASTYEDEKVLATSLRKCRPFRIVAGRKCNGFDNIPASPLSNIDLVDFRRRVDQVVTRLTYEQPVVVEEDRDEGSSSDED